MLQEICLNQRVCSVNNIKPDALGNVETNYATFHVDENAPLGGGYVTEVTRRVAYDGKWCNLVTISGSVSQAKGNTKQFGLGGKIRTVVSCVCSPNGDSHDWNVYAVPTILENSLTLEFEGNDYEVPFSYCVKLICEEE